MPEIVEHRVDADLLDFYLSNRTMESVSLLTEVFANKAIGLEKLQKFLPLRVERVLSRAKKIFIRLIDPDPESRVPDWWIIYSYGMTGRVSQRIQSHAHVEFKMSHSWIGFDEFYYSNVRRIGCFMEATNDPERYGHHVNDMAKPIVLGSDDMSDFRVISQEEFIDNISKCRHSYLVSKLMDQRSICSGIGNYYLLSECLYEAEENPDVRCSDLTSSRVLNLWRTINIVITEAYSNGGVSMTDYVHMDGTEGTHENQLKVYNREGQVASNGKVIEKILKGKHGRSIWFTVYPIHMPLG